jgi:DNA-damage-inducible protein J
LSYKGKKMAQTENTRSEIVNIRVRPELKKDVEHIFEQLGLTNSEAVRLFYKQVVHHNGLPFPVKIPNEATIAAMEEVASGKTKRFSDSDEFFEDLGI